MLTPKMKMIESISLFLKKLLAGIAVFLPLYFTPLVEHYTVIMILMLFDLATGLRASKVTGIKITSNRMKRTLTKFIIYSTALIIGLIVTQTYGIPVLYAISFYLASVEIKSISENMSLIHPNINLYKIIKDSLSSEKDKLLQKIKREKQTKEDSEHHKEQ